MVKYQVGSVNQTYEKVTFPFLLEHLKNCRPKEVAQHSERSMVIANTNNKMEFRKMLEKRVIDLTQSQQIRIKRVLKKVELL